MPEQQLGAVYGSGDGSLALIDYEGEKATTASVGGLNGPSSSIFMTRNEAYVFAASQIFDCFHGCESECRFVHTSQPSWRVPRQR